MTEERYRCFDDQCRSREGCLWWVARAGGQGRLGMTWRHGFEDPSLPCQHFEPLQEERCPCHANGGAE